MCAHLTVVTAYLLLSSGTPMPAPLEDVMFSLARKRAGEAMVHAPFQERDVATFGKMTRLKRLQLSHGGATNASLAYLGMLDFFGAGARFSQAAVTDFKRNMPRLGVFSGFETDYAPGPAQPPRPQRR